MTTLNRRTLGRTGVEITELGFGAMELRGAKVWGGRPVDKATASAVLNTVLDEGINFIDTAWCYGIAEELIGDCISHRRSEYVLATKCCIRFGPRMQAVKDCGPEKLKGDIEDSLRRMKTDCIDLIQLHAPTVEMAQEEDAVATLMEMQAEGKVRWIGISSFNDPLPTFLTWEAFDAYQIPYSLMQQEHEDAIRIAGQDSRGVIVRGGLAQGSAKAKDRFFEAGLDEFLDEGENWTDFMLRYTLSSSDLSTVIVGSLSPDHIRHNVRTAMRGKLPADVLAQVRERL